MILKKLMGKKKHEGSLRNTPPSPEQLIVRENFCVQGIHPHLNDVNDLVNKYFHKKCPKLLSSKMEKYRLGQRTTFNAFAWTHVGRPLLFHIV